MNVPHDAQLVLISASSGKAITAHGCRIRQSWAGSRDDFSQRWRLRPVTGARHTFRIENVRSGLLLTVADTAAGQGADIALEPGRGSRQQCWRLAPLHFDQYALVNLASGNCLDLWDARPDDDAEFGQSPFWDGPQQRWRLREVEPVRKTRALVTLVRDEPEFFPIWLGYYSRFFAPQDIYVLEHQPRPGLPADDRFVHIPVHNEVFSSDWQRDVVQRYQHDLVDRYDTVLCTDVDEIVAPDPGLGDLGAYIDRFSSDHVSCNGYEVLHLKDSEPAFDPVQNVLRQRSTWFPNPLYSKPLLARVPMMWRSGFHERFDGRADHDPDLYLIHLHRMDYEICLRRHERRSGHLRTRDDIDNNRGYQNRIVDPDAFHHWFYRDRVNGDPLYPEPIPERWQGVV
ncbi:RICIN domain-containing protein [Streptomyces rimosus]|uniref:RICIN domain-containing protein n=1 Tax=Streptomyces rimosus TaxID=1927 RepID=UPI0004C5EA21|nr:RICIN domain-containing protein [Streptomyces rimosus]